MTLNLRTTGSVFPCSETPANIRPLHDWCRRYWPGRSASRAHDVLAAARSEILLGAPVYLVAADYSAHAVRVCRDGSGEELVFECGAVSGRVLRHLEWCLNREAALAAARRLNSMAARAARASDTERVSLYDGIFGAAFCLWSTLRAAWDCGYVEDGEAHPSDLPATAFQWRALTMARLASPAAARLVHEAAASIHGLPAPAGDFDAGYGMSNLDYLFTEWESSEDAELSEGEDAALSQWAYRIYAPFTGPAPEGVEFPWHCAAASSHAPDAEPRFEDFDVPSAPVRGHAVRLA